MSDKQYAIGVDLGGTKLAVGVVGPDGRILARAERPTDVAGGVEAILADTRRAVNEALGVLGKGLGDVAGVGIGAPGPVEPGDGVVIIAPNLGWRDVPLGKLMQSGFGIPARVDNDANAAALGEQWCGAGRSVSDMVMVTLGTGVGGAIITHGAMYHGAHGYAGEIGHMTILEDGPLCGCGNRGCLETLAAAPAIARIAAEVIDAGRATRMSELAVANPGGLEAKIVFEAAREGDPEALGIVNQVARYLGIGLANLANILNPEMIVVGGGVSRAGDLLLDPVREEVRRRALRGPDRVKVVRAELGNDAGIIGAASLVWRG